MSAGRVVRVSVELPAYLVMDGGLARAMRELEAGSDGVIRNPSPHPYRVGSAVGTWAVIDDPAIPPAPAEH